MSCVIGCDHAVQSICSCLQDLAISFLGSLLAVVAVYAVYRTSAHQWQKESQRLARMWWLPPWNCYRLVLRNIEGAREYTDIAYRSWIREVELDRPGCSVKSFADKDLTHGERILLPVGQDLPTICFRLEPEADRFKVICTDKFGTPLLEHTPTRNPQGIYLELRLRAQRWGLLKHDTFWIWYVPYTVRVKSTGQTANFFKHLHEVQLGGVEREVPLLFGKGVVTAAI